MKIGMITDSLPQTDFDAMLAVAARLEMDMLEFGVRQLVERRRISSSTGCWKARRRGATSAPGSTAHGIEISALNCSGNPAAPGRSRPPA